MCLSEYRKAVTWIIYICKQSGARRRNRLTEFKVCTQSFSPFIMRVKAQERPLVSDSRNWLSVE